MNEKIYQKMLKIREADDLTIAPSSWLRDEIDIGGGKKVPLKLRSYQVQMIFHALLMKRFVIGDDTGLGKCSVKNSMISTTKGLIELGDMHDWSEMEPDTFEPIDKDWKVLVDGEALPVRNYYYGGVKPTVKAQTRYLFETEGSRVHPLLVWRDCEHQWVEMQDLREGDYLCVERREMDFPEEEPLLDTDVTTKGNSQEFPVPSQMNPDFARFLGYYIGEGSLTAKGQLRISQCPVVNPEIHEDIISLLKKNFNAAPKQPDRADLCVNKTHIRQFLYQNGLEYVTSHNRRVPDCILRSTRESNRQFLRGIFEGEGHVANTGGIELSTASEELGRQLQIMLLRFGIVSNRSPKVVKGFEHNDYWRLTIFGDDARIFRDKIGFVSQRKQDTLEDVLDRNSNSNHDVIPVAKPLVEDLRSLLKDALTKTGSNNNRKGSGFKQYGTSFVNTLNHIRNAGRNPTYDFVEKFLAIAKENGLEGTSPYWKLQELLRTRYFYDPVVDLEEGEEEVFDIEVDDPRHCFIANGLVNHNTLEVIATQCYLWEKEPDLIPIVVTNTSAMRQWGGEIKKFCVDEVSYTLVEGSPEDRAKIYEEFFENWDEENPSFLVVNYHRLRRDKRTFQALTEDKRLSLIFDEVTACKSTSSQTHKVCKQLAETAERVYGLTATLIKNNLEEGYGIFKVIHPEIFRSKKGFHRDYCITRKQRIPGMRKRYVQVVVGHTANQIDNFKEAIDPYYLGRAKHHVADELPPLTSKEIYVPMLSKQWDLYQESLSGLLMVHLGTEDEEEKETTKLTQLMYCQEIVNSPYLIGRELRSSKEEYFLELLKENFAEEKVIVFTRFRSMVDRFQGLLSENEGYKLGIEQDEDKKWVPIEDKERVEKGLVRITGDEDSEMRDAGKLAFCESENTNLIFLTMAGAEAINLQQARVMIFYDLPWSAGDYLQLVGRMIRIGSPHDRVYAVHLIGEGPREEETIDHHVLKTLQKKMGWIERALGERLVKESEGEIEGDGDEILLSVESDTDDIFRRVQDSARSLVG